MDLQSWLERNRDCLGSPYEVMFVENVLSRVPELDPSTLHAQFRFVDADGGTRYCDFVILESQELRIAMEVDGFDKRGTGQGMTRDEFVDWQRRQASLVTQGWDVLRFANVDVRDKASRCAEHVQLLLRQERSKLSHQRQLQSKIDAIEHDLARAGRRVAEEPAAYGDSTTPREEDGRTQSLDELKRLLEHAQGANQLTDEERGRLIELEAAQKNVVFLTKETSIMKTTIWALTCLIGFLIALFVLDRFGPGTPAPASVPVIVTAPVGTNPGSSSDAPVIPPTNSSGEESQSSTVGASCRQPLTWQAVRSRIGGTAAIIGPVARVAHRVDVKGAPTFITVGQPFPSRERMDVVIWGNRRSRFQDVLDSGLEGRDVCFHGEIVERAGVPQLVLRDRDQLQVR